VLCSVALLVHAAFLALHDQEHCSWHSNVIHASHILSSGASLLSRDQSTVAVLPEACCTQQAPSPTFAG
jgi:hypothetical protein